MRVGIGEHEFVRFNISAPKGAAYCNMRFTTPPTHSAVLEHAPYIARYFAFQIKHGVEMSLFKNCFVLMISNLPTLESTHFVYCAIHTLLLSGLLGGFKGEIYYTAASNDDTTAYAAKMYLPLTPGAEQLCERIIRCRDDPDAREAMELQLITGAY